ncbi:MFS transporter [Rhizocola hellebori]|uniref:MFS transporter n=1 Tax=Rhizocola hellebori TaxID=1392758 RepID=A0A8J3VCQ7_9ACTN|nr:MFS transporter [Rhizocola hellebori]GIH02020.1 MFS transporter [Rhizocola hellebori]
MPTRDLRLWMAGTSVSLFGDAALWLAAGMWAKELTGSNALAGLALLAYLGPRLLNPFTGYLADRFRRRPLIAGLNLMLAGWVLLALPVGAGQVWWLYLVLFGVGLGSGLHSAAGSALLTQLVAAQHLGRTTAKLRTLQEVGLLAAPAAGTALYLAAGPRAVIWLEAFTFLACAACVWAVRVHEPEPMPNRRKVTTELLAGMVHLARSAAQRDIVAAMAVALLAFGIFETAIFALVDQGLGRPAAFVGVLTFAKGVGSVLGGIAAVRLARHWAGAEGRATALGLGLIALGTAILLMGGTPAAVAGLVVIGSGIPMAIVGLFTVVQLGTPGPLQGRAVAAATTLVTAPQVASIALGAVLVSIVDYRLLLAAIVVVVAAGAVFLMRRNVGSVACVE